MTMHATLLGALAVSLAVTGSAKVFEAHSKCTVSAGAYTEEQLGEIRVEAIAYAQAYVCVDYEGDYDVPVDAPAVALATATAFAKAVANVFIDCTVKGLGSADANAYAHASTAGRAWLSAYADAWAASDVCGGENCSATAEAFLLVTEEVFLQAIANAEESIHLYSNDPNGVVSDWAKDVQTDIETATVTAIAEALATAKQTSIDDECFAVVVVGGSTPNNVAACASTGFAASMNKVEDAVATAVASASNYLCDDEGINHDEAVDVAQAIAHATAKVIAVSASACAVEGTAEYVCATSDADIDTIAIAIAEAFATGWAGSNNCNCAVGGDATVSSIGGILVEAAASAWAGVCPDGPVSNFNHLDFDLDFDSESDSAKALASAIISLVPGEKEGCKIQIDVETSVCECVEKPNRGRAVCKKRHSDEVLSCCEDKVCAKAGRRGVCRDAQHVAEADVLTPNCLQH